MGVYPGIPSVPQVNMFDMREEVIPYDCFVSQKKTEKGETSESQQRKSASDAILATNYVSCQTYNRLDRRFFAALCASFYE